MGLWHYSCLHSDALLTHFDQGRSAVFHICPEPCDTFFLMRSQRNARAFLKHHAQIFYGTLINFRIFDFFTLPQNIRCSQCQRRLILHRPVTMTTYKLYPTALTEFQKVGTSYNLFEVQPGSPRGKPPVSANQNAYIRKTVRWLRLLWSYVKHRQSCLSGYVNGMT